MLPDKLKQQVEYTRKERRYMYDALRHDSMEIESKNPLLFDNQLIITNEKATFQLTINHKLQQQTNYILQDLYKFSITSVKYTNFSRFIMVNYPHNIQHGGNVQHQPVEDSFEIKNRTYSLQAAIKYIGNNHYIFYKYNHYYILLLY